MGYYSTAVVVMTKELYVKCQLLQNIPEVMKDHPPKEHDTNIYWKLPHWKWYDGYPQIMELRAWFGWLEDESENPIGPEQGAIFGALRLGENNDDEESWGEPGHFDVYTNTFISDPFEE